MCFKKKNLLNDYHKKLNKIDKLFIRIFLSSLLLFSLLIIDKISFCNTFINSINDNINFVKYSKMFNGLFGNFIPINNDQTVNDTVYYDNIYYENNINVIQNYTFEGVIIDKSGVVTKIKKDKSNLYSITIKTEQGINYTYANLNSCNVRIYSYIMAGDIVGNAIYDETNKCYTFNLLIEQDGEYFDYYQKN